VATRSEPFRGIPEGKGRRNAPSNALKIVEFRPMPTARERIATAAKPGFQQLAKGEPEIVHKAIPRSQGRNLERVPGANPRRPPGRGLLFGFRISDFIRTRISSLGSSFRSECTIGSTRRHAATATSRPETRPSSGAPARRPGATVRRRDQYLVSQLADSSQPSPMARGRPMPVRARRVSSRCAGPSRARPGARRQRHPNPDLLRSLGHVLRHHAVDSSDARPSANTPVTVRRPAIIRKPPMLSRT